jgi:hypothetical protein
LLGQAGEEKE